MDRERLISKELVSMMGLALLVVYIVLAFISPAFKEIASRFVALIVAPGKDFLTIYSLIPIYLNWVSSEYFQEKITTSLGNAAKNGFTGLWVAMDWIRMTYTKYYEAPDSRLFAGKIFFAILMLSYTGLILKDAFKGQKVVTVIGRVREVSYFAIMITPIIYEVVPLDWTTIIAMLVFYPLFYSLIEFVMFLLPNPETAEMGY